MKIYITGEINDDMLFDLLPIFEQYRKGEDIVIEIDSNGGYLDIAIEIASILMTMKEQGSNITTSNIGNVMSAATIIYMVGNTRIFSPEDGKFLIHQPYFDRTSGNSDELIEQAIDLVYTEYDLADLYASFSDATPEDMLQRMKQETPLTEDELLKYNIATELHYEY